MANTAESLYVGDIAPYYPLFRVTNWEDLDIIEAADNDIYAVIASENIVNPTSNVATPQVRVYRVKKNVVSRTITSLDPKDLGATTPIRSDTWFLLPKIPYELVQKLDAFFRGVHKLHGSEAIAIFTYEPEFLHSEDPSAGWGVLIPDQENDGGHCAYDPPSVMAMKTDSSFIVGTMHSHPAMSAFFSGIDEHDQGDQDGLHITQGWQAKNDNRTEYYVAIYSDGKKYEFKPDQVFQTPPPPDVDVSEVEEWTAKVKKATHTTTHTHGHGASGTSSHRGYTHTSGAGTNYVPNRRSRPIRLPDNAPSPAKNVIVAEIPDVDHPQCPFCDMPLTPPAINYRRCSACASYLVLNGETVVEMHQHRIDTQRGYQIDIDPEAAPTPIVVWSVRDGEDVFSEDQRTQVGSSPK